MKKHVFKKLYQISLTTSNSVAFELSLTLTFLPYVIKAALLIPERYCQEDRAPYPQVHRQGI